MNHSVVAWSRKLLPISWQMMCSSAAQAAHQGEWTFPGHSPSQKWSNCFSGSLIKRTSWSQFDRSCCQTAIYPACFIILLSGISSPTWRERNVSNKDLFANYCDSPWFSMILLCVCVLCSNLRLPRVCSAFPWSQPASQLGSFESKESLDSSGRSRLVSCQTCLSSPTFSQMFGGLHSTHDAESIRQVKIAEACWCGENKCEVFFLASPRTVCGQCKHLAAAPNALFEMKWFLQLKKCLANVETHNALASL